MAIVLTSLLLSEFSSLFRLYFRPCVRKPRIVPVPAGLFPSSSFFISFSTRKTVCLSDPRKKKKREIVKTERGGRTEWPPSAFLASDLPWNAFSASCPVVYITAVERDRTASLSHRPQQSRVSSSLSSSSLTHSPAAIDCGLS